MAEQVGKLNFGFYAVFVTTYSAWNPILTVPKCSEDALPV